jgi:hypothetical protein
MLSEFILALLTSSLVTAVSGLVIAMMWLAYY